MKKSVSIILLIVILNIGMITTEADTFAASETITDLYGLSALLMDAETGEVLFEKNGDEPMAIASTTKILTCLIALEEGNLDDVVTISAYAASKPDVQMNAAEGEQYHLSDLLKGMMLESYNDISVAVAEHIAGTEEDFAAKMNEKAVEIGCQNSFFITPNGLDAEKNGMNNQSTARDLALILSHAIKNEDFLLITQTTECTISELKGKRTVIASNKNRFLMEYEGMLTGKTGFTGKAGYCYAGAAQKGDCTFVAVTLGSGWPPNKNYKWSDIRKLLDYGFEHYRKREIDYNGVKLPVELPVKSGADASGDKIESVKITYPEIGDLLLHDEESYYGKVYIKENLEAPIKKGDVLGRVEVYRNDKIIEQKDILSIDDVEKENIWINVYHILRRLFAKISGNLLKFIQLQGIIN